MLIAAEWTLHCIDKVFSSGLMHVLCTSSLQLFSLEERRRQCLQDLATLIQKIYRGHKCRSHFLLLKKSQIVVSAWYRRYAVRAKGNAEIMHRAKLTLSGQRS